MGNKPQGRNSIFIFEISNTAYYTYGTGRASKRSFAFFLLPFYFLFYPVAHDHDHHQQHISLAKN